MRRPVYLVRHGESVWNAQDLIQGQTAYPGLTGAGREQAYRAAEQIAADLTDRQLAVELITTSDLARAAQTAAVLAEVLGGELRTDLRLREQHLGELQGLTKERARRLQERAGWDVDAGESDASLRARMAAALADLDGSTVHVVVSHRRALRQVCAHLLGLADGEHIAVANGAVARWHADRLRWLP